MHAHDFQGITLSCQPQNCPHLWKSCACISYYLALVSPCIYSTISIIKKLQHNFPKMRVGSKAVWNFSENSSDLAQPSFTKICRCSNFHLWDVIVCESIWNCIWPPLNWPSCPDRLDPQAFHWLQWTVCRATRPCCSRLRAWGKIVNMEKKHCQRHSKTKALITLTN